MFFAFRNGFSVHVARKRDELWPVDPGWHLFRDVGRLSLFVESGSVSDSNFRIGDREGNIQPRPAKSGGIAPPWAAMVLPGIFGAVQRFVFQIIYLSLIR